MMPWRNTAALLVLSGVLASQTGCGDITDNLDGAGVEMYSTPEAGKRQGTGQVDMKSANGGAARVGSEQLIRIAEQVPGVDHAILAVSGNEVVIGIQVDNQDKSRIAEKQVVSQLMWQYPEYNYYVTADTELFDRVRTASQNQSAGQYRTRSVTSDNEISSIVDEIARRSVRP